MSTVWIPPVLRSAAGGAKQLQLAGGTVGEVINALISAHPSLGSQIRTPDGELNRFVNVYVNGQDIRYLGGESTVVAAADEVRLLPAMAGGSIGGSAGGSICGSTSDGIDETSKPWSR
jgi:molybdopterin converting factor small subunit